MNRLRLWTVSLLAAIGLLTGCNPSSDSDDDTGGGSQASLSAEDRAAGAAIASAGQFIDLSAMAQSQATGAADNGNTLSSSRSVLGRNAAVDCDGRVDTSANQGFKTDTTALTVDSRHWDSAAFSKADGFPDSGYTSDDYRARINCVIHDNDGNFLASYLGGFDMLIKTDIDGGPRELIHATSGGLDGASLDFSTAPDISVPLSVDTRATTSLSFDMRYHLQQCAGCVDGNLDDWAGDPDLDRTSVSFLYMDMTINGSQTQIQAGTQDEPFFFQSADTGLPNDQANVLMNGRLQFGGASACGYDVSMSTSGSTGVVFSDMSGDPVPQSGTLNITDNKSGQTFTVQFSGGNPTVRDSSGTVLTPDTNALDQCGFLS